MSQKERLLDYLKQHGTINPLESWQQLGIYRLSDVVLQLRKCGHNIKTEFIEVHNRFDEPCRVAKYVYSATPADITDDDNWIALALDAIRGVREDLSELEKKLG